VTWSRWPPVHSPVSTRALLEGTAAAFGLLPRRSEAVAAILRARYDADAVLLTDSGTSALALALQAILPRGGTVAYPSYGCIDLSTAAIGASARVRLYDLDPLTLSPDIDSLRRTIKRGVDAVVVAHFYGYPADVPGVRAVAAEEGIPVIEDAAQSAGGSLSGVPLGGLGDIAVLSFGRGKGTTGGSGGAVIAKNRLAKCVGPMHSGIAPATNGGEALFALAAQKLFSHPRLYRIPASIPALRLGEMIYHQPHPPRAMSLTAAAVLRRTLDLDEREVSARRSRAEALMRNFRHAPQVTTIRPIPGAEPGFLRLPVIDQVGSMSPRPDLGIMRGYPMTLDEHSELGSLLLAGERAGTGSRFLRDRLYTIPTHSAMGSAELAGLAGWFEAERIDTTAVPAVS
jgi:perosamine synthetase